MEILLNGEILGIAFFSYCTDKNALHKDLTWTWIEQRSKLMIQVFIVEYRTGEAHNMRTHTFHFMTCTHTNVGMLHAWIKVLSILFYIPPCLFRITLLNAHIHMSHQILSYHVKIQFEFYFDDIKVTLDGVVVVVWCVLLLLKNRKSEAAKVLYLLPLSFPPCDP